MLARRVLELDFEEISSWFRVRGEHMPDRSLFPKTGFIIDGIAAGFLYFTDSALGIIDCYVSNPDSEKEVRGRALDAITEALIDTARFHKCKIVKCDTTLDAIKHRALKHGFKCTGAYNSFTLGDLNG